MSIKDFTKSGTFVLSVLLLVVVLLPFAAEQVGETTGLFDFPVTKWVKRLFSASGGRTSSSVSAKSVDWAKQLQDLKDFSDWADGLTEAKIAIVRPEVFQIARADPNPATATHFSWKLQLLSASCRLG